MLSRLSKNLLRLSIYLFPAIILGCNTGSNNSSPSSVNQGQLQLSGRDSQMALGGTHEYIVSLVGSQNLPAPVSVNVSTSNSSVLSIESNTCSTQVLYSNDYNLNTSCSFYVRGNSIGRATISVTSSSYPIMQESVTVAKQWGTYSSVVRSEYGDAVGVSKLSFGGNKVYAYDEYANIVSTTGDGWQIVGGESVTADGFDTFMSMSSDESHVCVSLEKSNSVLDKLRCSTNGGPWYDLPSFEDGFRILNVSLYKDKIYILINWFFTGAMYVKSCPLDNCTSWQQIGESFSTSMNSYDTTILFESTSYITENTGIYYQTNAGDWQLYGAYQNNSYCYLSASESGVAVFPKSVVLPPYEQSVYYNGTNNMGGVFEAIGESISVYADTQEGTSIFTTNNNIYTTPGDGNVYVSNNTDNAWSQWSRVGINNPLLANVYYHDNKLYSLDLQDGKSQIYIYPLDNN